VAQGILSFFGTYTVDDADKEVIMRIIRSSFPNINNVEQRRAMILSGDELTLVNQAGSSGGTAETKWKRVK
jgi:Lipocalin-like domain